MTRPDPPPPPLPPEDRRELLRVARVSLRGWLRTGHLPPGAPHRPSLTALRPCAVALHDGSGARAAASHLAGDRPLYLAVEALAAVCAARLDEPLTPEAVSTLRFEIALIEEVADAPGAAHIVPGVHGVRVVVGDREGVILPAPDQRRWSPDEVARAACLAGRLGADAWASPGARLTRFTVDTFADPPDPAATS